MHPYLKYIKDDGSLDYQKLYEEMANADTFLKKQNQEKLYLSVTEWFNTKKEKENAESRKETIQNSKKG